MPAISKSQIQLIKIAQKELAIDDEDYRDMLEKRFKVRSCTDLSHLQAGNFIDELRKKGFKPRHTRRTPRRRTRPKGTNVVALASYREVRKIGALKRLIQWKADDGFERWLEKRYGTRKVKTAGQAYKVIEGLKHMFENQMKKEHGAAWWTRRYPDPDIERYILEHKIKGSMARG